MKLIFGRLCDEHRKMKQQKLLSLIRQAIQDYNMIEDGDRIAVGVSRRQGFPDSALCDEAAAGILPEEVRIICDYLQRRI